MKHRAARNIVAAAYGALGLLLGFIVNHPEWVHANAVDRESRGYLVTSLWVLISLGAGASLGRRSALLIPPAVFLLLFIFGGLTTGGLELYWLPSTSNEAWALVLLFLLLVGESALAIGLVVAAITRSRRVQRSTGRG